MINLIDNVIASTNIFIAIFSVIFLATLRKSRNKEFFPNAVSQELKGLAILMIVFSHIGYFLVEDHRFLFPLTVAAGVGVDLFLLLSGFGITMSAMKKDLTAGEFYKKRLLKLFVPFWIVLVVFFIMDFFFLEKSYGINYMARSFCGLFPHADLYADVNSPLWYFTLTLFYYLLFPLVFRKNFYWLSAVIIYAVSYGIMHSEPSYLVNVLHLYEVHLTAFPLGMVLAGIISNRSRFSLPLSRISRIFNNRAVNAACVGGLLVIAAYFAYYSNVGTTPLKAELTSLLVVFALLGIFLMKRIDSKMFSVFGTYSYEIYLLHWPIMHRYDIFYNTLPGWLATLTYLGLFLFLGWILKKFQDFPQPLPMRIPAFHSPALGRIKIFSRPAQK